MKCFFRIALLTFFIHSAIHPVPRAVVMIRHGEKQVKDYVEKKGKKKPKYTAYLSVKGWMRAYALVPFFTEEPDDGPAWQSINLPSVFGRPDFIFASGPAKAGDSLRPVETVTPLAKILGKEVISSFTAPEYSELAKYIMNDPKFNGSYIVISFEHHHIPLLAKAMGIKQAPKTWGDVFDRAWVTEFDQQTREVASFHNYPQRLLYGDSKN